MNRDQRSGARGLGDRKVMYGSWLRLPFLPSFHHRNTHLPSFAKYRVICRKRHPTPHKRVRATLLMHTAQRPASRSHPPDRYVDKYPRKQAAARFCMRCIAYAVFRYDTYNAGTGADYGSHSRASARALGMVIPLPGFVLVLVKWMVSVDNSKGRNKHRRRRLKAYLSRQTPRR